MAKRILLAATSTVLGIIIAVVGLEGWIRIFKPARYFDSPRDGYLYRPLSGGHLRRYWTMRPHTQVCGKSPEDGVICFDTNDLGFRGSWTAPKKKGVRIAAIGDSFIAGAFSPESDLVTTQLQRRLARRGVRPVEVINMGVDNWDLFHYYRTLDAFQKETSPDIVLVFICIANDLEDYRAEFPLQPRTTGEKVRSWLERHSYLFSERPSIDDDWMRPSAGLRVPAAVRDAVLRAYPGISEKLGMHLCYNLHQQIYQYLRPPRETELYSSSVDMLRAIKEVALGHGARLALVLIPSKDQVLDPNWLILREMLHSEGYADGEMERLRPQREILAAAKQASIPVIDLYPEFSKRRAEGLYFRIDGHWNRKGQALAAKVIADSLDF